MSIHVNNQCHPRAVPPHSSATPKQRLPQAAPPPRSATLKQHMYWFRQPTHPFIYLTLDHAKTNTNTKTTNETTTRRRRRKTIRQTRCPHKDKHENENNERGAHAKMNPTTQKFNTATPDHRANQGACIITKGAGESRRLPNHKGCQCHIIMKSETEQSH